MVLAIPRDAVLDTGVRKIVWVDKGEGEFEGKIVAIGPESVATIDFLSLPLSRQCAVSALQSPVESG